MNICYYCGKSVDSPEKKYGLHPKCFLDWFELSESMDFVDLSPKETIQTSRNIAIEKVKDTFFHGQYLKYSASLNNESYILKIQEDDYPDLPATEYLCNKIAEVLRLDVPKYYLINFLDKITFVTRNFMQDYTGVLHHIYKFLPSGEDHYNCEEIINVIFSETNKLSEINKFINICLFDALVGNNDRHGRNLGIIESVNLKRLAPMYDNPSFLGVQPDFLLGAHFNASGSIWTKDSKEPGPKDYLFEFKRLGYIDSIQDFLVKTQKNIEEIRHIVLSSHMSVNRKNTFIRFINERYEEFMHAI